MPFDWPIIVYMILAGCSAGAAMTGVVAMLSKKVDLTIVRQSLWIAVLLLLAGLPFLVLDLEQPHRFFSILYYANPTSVIAWGARGLMLYVFLLLVLLYLLRRSGDVSVFPRGVAAIVLVAALFVGLYPGFVLSQAVARPLWLPSVLPALFLVSGMHMGLAIVAAARLWTASDPTFEPIAQDPFLQDHVVIRWLDMALIAIQIILAILYFRSCLGSAPEAAMQLTTGGFGMLLWGGVVVVGWVLPTLDILVRGAKSNLWARSFFTMAGGVCLRVLVILGGQEAVAFVGR